MASTVPSVPLPVVLPLRPSRIMASHRHAWCNHLFRQALPHFCTYPALVLAPNPASSGAELSSALQAPGATKGPRMVGISCRPDEALPGSATRPLDYADSQTLPSTFQASNRHAWTCYASVPSLDNVLYKQTMEDFNSTDLFYSTRFFLPALDRQRRPPPALIPYPGSPSAEAIISRLFSKNPGPSRLNARCKERALPGRRCGRRPGGRTLVASLYSSPRRAASHARQRRSPRFGGAPELRMQALQRTISAPLPQQKRRRSASLVGLAAMEVMPRLSRLFFNSKLKHR